MIYSLAILQRKMTVSAHLRRTSATKCADKYLNPGSTNSLIRKCFHLSPYFVHIFPCELIRGQGESRHFCRDPVCPDPVRKLSIKIIAVAVITTITIITITITITITISITSTSTIAIITITITIIVTVLSQDHHQARPLTIPIRFAKFPVHRLPVPAHYYIYIYVYIYIQWLCYYYYYYYY